MDRSRLAQAVDAQRTARQPRPRTYAAELRAVGQGIEQLKLAQFEIEANQDDYMVRSLEGEAQQWRWPPDVVERLEHEGRRRRQRAEGMPEAHRPSQVLRALGQYLDNLGARPKRITKGIEEIVMVYETSVGRKVTESRTLSSVYDLWVRMYLRRRTRN